ncbi:alpha/beta fold hydrolase [Streptomyces sp. NPDC059917]|uniref:alpha/beta fold hydrolase n=1 Tax=Streptomyces sp. NPDC059917 TaxID=3347002 RepID=UPI00366803D0
MLLHGAGMDSRLWDAVVPELARRHDVIRYDARGLGRSTPPGGPFGDVDDLRAVLDHFGLRRAALVGLSMGGETALDFALEHPERVGAPTLVVHGDRDHPEIAVIAERLVADVPGARGASVPDADHYLPLRTPRRLAELLVTHLT